VASLALGVPKPVLGFGGWVRSGFDLASAGYLAARNVSSTPLKGPLKMLWFIIVLLVVGFLAGALARLLVPGPDPMSLGGTWLLGVIGSFVGGFLGYVLFGADLDDGAVQVSGIIGSILGAVIVLLVYRTFNRDKSLSR
jgi:uncharacterized membrane protein YeaQ/YmgE (transglycosylase-associated protein family)